MEFNQTGIDLGYMFFTSRRDDEVLVSWTIFYFFRKKIDRDCINISKFTNNDRSRCECTGRGFKGWEKAGGGHIFFSGKHF